MNENILIQSSINGDKIALSKLLKQYRIHLFSFIKRHIRSIDVAEDLLQESLYSVVKSINSFTGENFRGWIFTIAKNQCYSYFRRKNLEDASFMKDTLENDEDFISIFPDRSFNSEEKMASCQSIQSIMHQIDQLPPAFANVARLRAQGMEMHEIAEQENIPLNTVATRMFRARRLLTNQI